MINSGRGRPKKIPAEQKIRELDFAAMAKCAIITDANCLLHNSEGCFDEETNTKNCLNYDFCYDFMVIVDRYRKKFSQEIKEEES